MGGPFPAARARRVLLVVVLTLAAATAGGGLYVARIVFSDHLVFRQGGAAYVLIVRSETVRGFPRFAAAGREAEFTYSARDGTAPGVIAMTYASAAGAGDLAARYRDHCRRRGYAPVADGDRLLDSRLACDAADYRIEIAFAARGGATRVTVTFLER